MKIRILLILVLLLSLSAYSWLNVTTLSNAESIVAATATEEETPAAGNEKLLFHVLQKTNIFSILIVGLEIFIIVYYVWIAWISRMA